MFQETEHDALLAIVRWPSESESTLGAKSIGYMKKRSVRGLGWREDTEMVHGDVKEMNRYMKENQLEFVECVWVRGLDWYADIKAAGGALVLSYDECGFPKFGMTSMTHARRVRSVFNFRNLIVVTCSCGAEELLKASSGGAANWCRHRVGAHFEFRLWPLQLQVSAQLASRLGRLLRWSG